MHACSRERGDVASEQRGALLVSERVVRDSARGIGAEQLAEVEIDLGAVQELVHAVDAHRMSHAAKALPP